MSKPITAERLREVLSYEPETGIFTWLNPASNRVTAGGIAGSTEGNYLRIAIDNTSHYAQRLAWLYMTGHWPEGPLDHINRIRRDNRWTNIRPATTAENNRNRSAQSTNLIGLKGVSKHGSRYRGACWVDKQRVQKGGFLTPLEAFEWVSAIRNELHGQYANHGEK